MDKIEIKKINGNLIFSHNQEDNTVKKTLEKAVSSDANLIGANLIGANLSGANLRDANLSGANLIDANNIEAKLSVENIIF